MCSGMKSCRVRIPTIGGLCNLKKKKEKESFKCIRNFLKLIGAVIMRGQRRNGRRQYCTQSSKRINRVGGGDVNL